MARSSCHINILSVHISIIIAISPPRGVRIATTYFGAKLKPGAGCADHGDGIRLGFVHVFPGVKLAGCWPHIAWKMAQGKLAKGLGKSHPKFESVKDDLHELHTCQTTGMWDVLLLAIGREWGNTDRALNSLWSERLVAPCNNWYIGYTDVPGATPSNQPIENWHNVGVMQVLAGELRASTAYVLTVSLPKIMKVDGPLHAPNPRYRTYCT